MPDDAHEVYKAAPGRTATVGSGSEFDALGGGFTFDGGQSELLLRYLPDFMLVEGASPHATTFRWLQSRLASEMSAPALGSSMVSQHLGHLLLVEVLRAYLANLDDADSAGWLSAVADPKIGAALRLMHEEPMAGWSLPALAARAGMSRSAFAERFKGLVGQPPMEYLARWRLQLAANALRSGSLSVGAVALSHGYQSESAFSNAFQKAMGLRPNQLRSRAKSRA